MSPNIRRLAVVTLAFILVGCGAKSTGDWLTQLKGSDVTQRRQAIRELGERAGDAQRVVPALSEALRDENQYVRRDAAVALAKFGDGARSAVPALKTALKDKDQNVRHSAAATLRKVSPEDAPKEGK